MDERFVLTVELAVRLGKTLIVKECDRVEPVLYSLLRKDLRNEGAKFTVQLGDRVVDYNERFCLYLVTRNSDIYLPPVSSIAVS